MYGFKKKERLKSAAFINKVYASGDIVKVYPFVVHYLKLKDLSNPQIAVSIPKRIFRRAVQRNLIKRRIREAYRLNKEIILANPANAGMNFAILFVYIGKEMYQFKFIEKKIIELLHRLKDEYDI